MLLYVRVLDELLLYEAHVEDFSLLLMVSILNILEVEGELHRPQWKSVGEVSKTLMQAIMGILLDPSHKGEALKEHVPRHEGIIPGLVLIGIEGVSGLHLVLLEVRVDGYDGGALLVFLHALVTVLEH
jgi:hypothetical protein